MTTHDKGVPLPIGKSRQEHLTRLNCPKTLFRIPMHSCHARARTGHAACWGPRVDASAPSMGGAWGIVSCDLDFVQFTAKDRVLRYAVTRGLPLHHVRYH
jgi:hypothetical protein